MNGSFITFEGPEGAGKTVIIKYVKEHLEKLGYDIMATREPGGIEIAEQIREVILNPSNTSMDARTECLLYAAARRQHLTEKVFPALKEGKIVLCDRFIDSSLAYQGYARGLGIEEVLRINHFATESLMPNITFLLDVLPQVGLERIQQNRSNEVNRLDLESLEFHQKVRDGYFKVVDIFPSRFIIVDANQSIEHVVNDVIATLEQYIHHSKKSKKRKNVL